MTRVYFVCHAQPEHNWKEDRIRPLTEKGRKILQLYMNFWGIRKSMPFIAVRISVAWIPLQRQQHFSEKKL